MRSYVARSTWERRESGTWNACKRYIGRPRRLSVPLSLSLVYHRRGSKGKKKGRGVSDLVVRGKRMGFDETMADRWRTDGGRRSEDGGVYS